MAAPKASRARVTLERAGGDDVGTVRANIDLVSKVCAERGRWGGVRNRRDRVTTALSLQQVRDVLTAVAFAERIDLPLNRMVTVHWGAMGVTDADAGRALARLLKLWREALAARGLPFACVWVRENDDGDGSKGSHVHILAHVPPGAGAGFLRRLRAWVRLAAGGRYVRPKRRGKRRKGKEQPLRARVVGPAYVAGAVLTRRIGGKLAAEPDAHRVNLAEAVGYLVKGGDKLTADILALERREPGGRVIGKRCGWSENVGKAVRSRKIGPDTVAGRVLTTGSAQ